MSPLTSRVVVLRRRPEGEIVADDFSIEQRAVRAPADGEVLTRTAYLSLDPLMRMRMLDSGDATSASPVGQVISGRVLSEVIESRDARFRPGDLVLGWAGWRDIAVESADELMLVDDADGHPSHWLGVLGRPGITAWLGIALVAQVSEHDTVIVSSAAGAVGSVAAQLAASRGARVAGIAGGPSKCDWLTRVAGLAAAVDYSAPDFLRQLEAATPDGATVVFESVGGRILDASIARLVPGGQVALCGLLDRYQGRAPYPYENFHLILERGLSVRGFRIDDYTPSHGHAIEELRGRLSAGTFAVNESITDGLENTPEAFIGLLSGVGFGKHLVRVQDATGS